MAIRFRDQNSYLGRIASTLQDVAPAIAGTFAPAATRTGVISSPLQNVTAAVAGIFTAAPNRTGSISQALQNASAAFTGTFLPASLRTGSIAQTLQNVSSSIAGTFTLAASTAPPYIVGIDIPWAPTANLATGSENNKGWYITVVGRNLGDAAGWANGSNHLYIGGVEVDNYRYFGPCVDTIYAEFGLQIIRAQLGALGNPTANVALPVTVSIGGVGPSNSTSGGFLLDDDDEVISFTPVVGTCKFVSKSGSNSNDGSFSAPLRNHQTSSGSAGAFIIGGSANTTTATPPATFVCTRTTAGDSWNESGWVPGGGETVRFISFMRITGLLNRPIHWTQYPGPSIAVNTQETFAFSPPAGCGFISGADSTRANESSTAYGGFNGYFQYVVFSCLEGASSPSAPADGGPWNLQNRAQNVRMVNCSGTWPPPVGALRQSAGIEGSPINGRFIAVSMFNIGGTSAEEAHAYYWDGYNGTFGTDQARGNIVKYFIARDISGGSGLNHFQTANGTGALNNKMHHGRIQNVSKHGLNLGQGTTGFIAHDILFKDIGQSVIRTDTTEVIATRGIYIYNCFAHGWGTSTSSASRYLWQDTATIGSGTAVLENTAAVQSASHANNGWDWVSLNSAKVSFAKVREFDPNGQRPTPSAGAVAGDPLVTNLAAGDYSLQATSPCIGAGNTPTQLRRLDYALNVAPQGSATDIGIRERVVATPTITVKQFWRRNVNASGSPTLVSGVNPLVPTPGSTLLAVYSQASLTTPPVPTSSNGTFVEIPGAQGDANGTDHIYLRFATIVNATGSHTITPTPAPSGGEVLQWIFEVTSMPTALNLRYVRVVNAVGDASQSWNIASIGTGSQIPAVNDVAFAATTYENTQTLASAQLTDPATGGWTSGGVSQDATNNLPTQVSYKVVTTAGQLSAAWTTVDTHKSEHISVLVVLIPSP